MTIYKDMQRSKGFYKKNISSEEVEIIKMLEELSLSDLTLVHSLIDNTLYEKIGMHQSRLQWDILKIYDEILRPLQSIRTYGFTPGIYSFMSSGENIEKEDYLEYIVEELNTLIKVHEKSSLVYTILRKVKKSVVETKENGILIDQFSLLHGDLYNGNILMLDGKYKLIDFEYLRFGPTHIEWAFLLFWDLIVEKDREKRKKIFQKVKVELRELTDKRTLSIEQIKQIVDIFIPIILCASLHYSLLNKYENSKEISNGIIKFWNLEYVSFQKGEW